MAYTELSDEDKILQAISFVCRGAALPKELEEFLVQNDLYELITAPQESKYGRYTDKRQTG